MPSNNSEERNKRIQGMIDGFNMEPLTPDNSYLAELGQKGIDGAKVGDAVRQIVDELKDLDPDMVKRVFDSLTPKEIKQSNENRLIAIQKKKAFMQSFQGVAINAINQHAAQYNRPWLHIKTKIK